MPASGFVTTSCASEWIHWQWSGGIQTGSLVFFVFAFFVLGKGEARISQKNLQEQQCHQQKKKSRISLPNRLRYLWVSLSNNWKVLPKLCERHTHTVIWVTLTWAYRTEAMPSNTVHKSMYSRPIWGDCLCDMIGDFYLRQVQHQSLLCIIYFQGDMLISPSAKPFLIISKRHRVLCMIPPAEPINC